jgi:osmotically-inducible protein OsmY
MPRKLFHVALAAIALAAGACASGANLDTTYRDVSADLALKRILFADTRHDYSDIDLTLFDGRLLLTGTMRSEQGRRRLVENAWKARGVEQVIDEVLVADKTSISDGFNDNGADHALRASLLADRAVVSSNYKFAVSRGVIYIIGVARDAEELDSVLETARARYGVTKVVSHVVYRDAARQRAY